MNPHGNLTRDQLEARRMDAAKLFNKGLIPARVSEILDVSRTTAGRWGMAFRQAGVPALKKRVPSGRPSKLSEPQRMKLQQLYEQGPRAAGHKRDYWTNPLLAKEVLKRFGIRYDHDHIGRILRQMGVNWKQKRREARQAN